MKSILVGLLTLFCLGNLNAQVGIHGGYKTMQANVWEGIMDEFVSQGGDQIWFKGGFSIGIDYWFRLPKQRVEFTPELSFSQIKSPSIDHPRSNETIDLAINFVSLQFNTNVYVMDFKGDCNCPTFSKDGTSIQKGFFIQLSPGVSYIQKNYTDASGSTASNSFAPNLALGVGFDIGVSDFITVTPYLRAQRHFNILWDDFQNHFTENKPILIEENTSDIDQLHFGLRLGFRFDELYKYR